MRRFISIYVSVFTVIWIGFGIYSVITRQPHGTSILLFGIGFCLILLPAAWFSQWLMKSYRRTDTLTQEFLAKKTRNRR